ncbi:MAG: V-type ATP synthase subunit K [Clostridiales bacterium]|jgi:V/A-type H+-transporting ATPase subunit K|nr:V-type ATP synthase subunit K [Clostridiales bacterium]
MVDFFMQYGGIIIGGFGAALSVFLPGIGSSRGCGLVGKTATGLLTEEPEKFGQALILQLLPGTQGLYGFLIAFLIINNLTPTINLAQGFFLLFAALPVAFAGYRSALYQGEVAAAGLQILAKKPEENTKGIILAAIVETYAILGLVGSLILLVVAYPNIARM